MRVPQFQALLEGMVGVGMAFQYAARLEPRGGWRTLSDVGRNFVRRQLVLLDLGIISFSNTGIARPAALGAHLTSGATVFAYAGARSGTVRRVEFDQAGRGV